MSQIDNSITYLIAVSDLHLNSCSAVCPPVVNLDDGGTYHASPLQRELYRCWLDFAGKVARLEGRKILLLNGDLGELDTKRRSLQLITINKATILRMVIDTLEPFLSVTDQVIVIRGTAAHEGKSAWLEEAVAQDLDNVIPCAEHLASWWHMRRVLEGVRLDIAHHATMSTQWWTGKNAANTLAWRTILNYAAMSQPAPNLVLRSHNHIWADSSDNYPLRVIYLPAWTGATEYTYRIGLENTCADTGGLIVRCESGAYEIEKVRYTPKVNKIWAMKL
jgi:hypothetical protein